MHTFPEQSNTVNSLAFSHDGHRLAVGNAGGGVSVYDVSSGRLLLEWHYKNNLKKIVVAFNPSPQGEHILALAAEENAEGVGLRAFATAENPAAPNSPQLWDVETNHLLKELPGYLLLENAALSFDGEQIALIGLESIRDPGQMYSALLVDNWITGTSYNILPVNFYSLDVLFFTPDKHNLLLLYGFDGCDYSQIFNAPLQTPPK